MQKAGIVAADLSSDGTLKACQMVREFRFEQAPFWTGARVMVQPPAGNLHPVLEGMLPEIIGHDCGQFGGDSKGLKGPGHTF